MSEDDRDFLGRLLVRPIGPEIRTDSFTCDPNLDYFLKTQALEFHLKRVDVVTCWMDGDDVAGYMATNMTEIELQSPMRKKLELQGMKTTETGKFTPTFPAIKIGMLGVCTTYRRRHLAEEMVTAAVGQAFELSSQVGCRFVIVDSDRNPGALALYRKLDFQEVEGYGEASDRKTVLMYYDLGPVIRTTV
jgi:ribosomal protein S18 acetylase RimI-like enzyme